MLKVEDLNVYYDKIHAIKGASFEVRDGEICTLIGANGAGKTTILQTISGLLQPKSGKITLDGSEITGRAPNKILLQGLAQVPEGRRVFSKMTVLENLEMGAYTRKDAAGIKERIHQQAGTLSGGEQQMLAIGRALMSRPRMLLLDEPSMGLAPILVDEIFSIIRQVNQSGVTVLLVEQNAAKALEIAHYSYVLATGQIVSSGEGKSMLTDSSVRSAYLG